MGLAIYILRSRSPAHEATPPTNEDLPPAESLFDVTSGPSAADQPIFGGTQSYSVSGMFGKTKRICRVWSKQICHEHLKCYCLACIISYNIFFNSPSCMTWNIYNDQPSHRPPQPV